MCSRRAGGAGRVGMSSAKTFGRGSCSPVGAVEASTCCIGPKCSYIGQYITSNSRLCCSHYFGFHLLKPLNTHTYGEHWRSADIYIDCKILPSSWGCWCHNPDEWFGCLSGKYLPGRKSCSELIDPRQKWGGQQIKSSPSMVICRSGSACLMHLLRTNSARSDMGKILGLRN